MARTVYTRKIIDDTGADSAIAAAAAFATERGHRVVIAVVDPWGELIQLRRTPGAQIASSRVAVDKLGPRRSSFGRAVRWKSR